jgi:hypothetical protein
MQPSLDRTDLRILDLMQEPGSVCRPAPSGLT